MSASRAAPLDREAAQELGIELIGICVAGLGPYGVNASRILKSTVRRHKGYKGHAAYAQRLLRDVHWLGELATEWTENPRYIDDAGRPKVLPIEGNGVTLSALVRKYFGQRKTAQILDLAQRTRVMERVQDDKVALLNACVMLTGQPALLLARAILCVRGLLQATARNGFSTETRDGLSPDRLALGYVAKENFGEFAALMRPQLHSVVDQGNRWLSENAVRDRPGDTDQNARLMGVHAYVFGD